MVLSWTHQWSFDFESVQEVEARVPVHEDGVPLAVLLSDNLQPLKEQKEQDEAASDPPSSPREISETLHDPTGGTGVAGQQGNLQQSDVQMSQSSGGGQARAGDSILEEERPNKAAKVEAPKRARLQAPPVHAGNVGR